MISAIAEGGTLTKTINRMKQSSPTINAQQRAALCARVAEDHKGRDVVILDMRGVTPLYDYFVIATGTSRRQIHTLAEEIDAALEQVGDSRMSIQGYEASKWVVQDYGDIVIHVFDDDTREYYALEELWADAPRLNWKE